MADYRRIYRRTSGNHDVFAEKISWGVTRLDIQNRDIIEVLKANY